LSGVTLGAPENAAMLTGLLVAWVFLIVSALFLRRAYGTMSSELGVGTFRTAAALYLVGAALTIVVVGFILLLVAQILQAMAYFSIPDQPPTKGAGASLSATGIPPPSMPPQGGAAKFCASCGTQISPSAAFCYSCGAKQTPRLG